MLGKGGFAKCYEITNIDNKRVYAAKIIPKSTLTKNRSRQKVIILGSLFQKLKYTSPWDISMLWTSSTCLKITRMYTSCWRSAPTRLIIYKDSKWAAEAQKKTNRAWSVVLFDLDANSYQISGVKPRYTQRVRKII